VDLGVVNLEVSKQQPPPFVVVLIAMPLIHQETLAYHLVKEEDFMVLVLVQLVRLPKEALLKVLRLLGLHLMLLVQQGPDQKI